MNRSTLETAVPGAMLETLLQNRLGLKYMQSRKLVASGREKLGMEKSEQWTPELEAECIKLYEDEHGPVKQKDYSSPEPTKTTAEEPKKDATPSNVPASKSAVSAPVPPRPSFKKKEEEPNPAEDEETATEPEKTPDQPKEAEETPEEPKAEAEEAQDSKDEETAPKEEEKKEGKLGLSPGDDPDASDEE